MNQLSVRLWGEELGRLVWDARSNKTYFSFNPAWRDRPDVAPLANPKAKWNTNLPVFGDSRRIYQGLPPFIADSLPDSWGNKLFDQWAHQNRISRDKISPLSKLMFIGRRGMGALEFEPAARELERLQPVNLENLYQLSLEVLHDRESVALDAANDLTMKTLLAVGTSAGGRQMKAIIALNPDTMQIRSGQTEAPDGFEYFIIKFEDDELPTTEIEMAYYEMARASGIDMEECLPFQVEGVSHFMTRRFDRKNGEKVHMQTLAAINPEADSYEALFETAKRLGLSQEELEQLYTRMVFNILANNTDDHNKNFSFLLERGGNWRLAPAYDLTFIFNRFGSGPDTHHVLSIHGKTNGFDMNDLLDFAKEHSISNPEAIISKVADALAHFPQAAEKYGIPDQWSLIIGKTLLENLASFGFIELPHKTTSFSDSAGRKIQFLSLVINRKRRYHLSVRIDGVQRKRIIAPGTAEFQTLQEYELGKLTDAEFFRFVETLFPA